MIIQAQTDTQGRFNTEGIVAAVVQGGFAQQVYYVAEDLLRESVNRTPLKTSHLRETGNVDLDGMSLIQLSKGGRGFALHMSPNTVAAYATQLALTGQHTFTFSVGFNTPYACVIHEGTYRLGRRSVRASARHKKTSPVWQHGTAQFGKIGPKFMTRAWQDNEAKYLAYLKSFGGKGGVKVV
jgi:hypothetical protein